MAKNLLINQIKNDNFAYNQAYNCQKTMVLVFQDQSIIVQYKPKLRYKWSAIFGPLCLEEGILTAFPLKINIIDVQNYLMESLALTMGSG